MRKFFIRLFLVILAFTGLIGYVFGNRATPASSCAIATYITQISKSSESELAK